MAFASHCTAHLMPPDKCFETEVTMESFEAGSRDWSCARHCKTLSAKVCRTLTVPFPPSLAEEALMGNLVWENSDKWPLCGEGIGKKGRGEKRDDNREGMLFLEERFKEEADHVTVMDNTTCIFHKNRGNQHYDSSHSINHQSWTKSQWGSRLAVDICLWDSHRHFTCLVFWFTQQMKTYPQDYHSAMQLTM